MIIGAAQIKPFKGDIDKNIETHVDVINYASSHGLGAIFFPELSITGYEPSLADFLQAQINDNRFQVFQELSNTQKITIGIGAPTKSTSGIEISMLIFQPFQPIQKYSKQILHKDEYPFFVKGDRQIILSLDQFKIAPAICYESLQLEHVQNAKKLNANLYLASVAKSQKGIDKANDYFPKVAKENAIPILMSNCIGPCDDFIGAGQSAVWNRDGKQIAVLPKDVQGIVAYDTVSKDAKSFLLN